MDFKLNPSLNIHLDPYAKYLCCAFLSVQPQISPDLNSVSVLKYLGILQGNQIWWRNNYN